MKQRSTTHIIFKATFAVLLAVASILPVPAQAQQITSRKVTLGSSQPSTSTSHNFTFTAPQSTTIQSIEFLYCDTPSGACTPGAAGSNGVPAGINTNTAALNGAPANLGSAGTWSVAGAPSQGRVRISATGAAGSPSAGSTVNFNTITNPSIVSGQGKTFYVRIATFSDAAWSTPIDSGVVAGAVTNQIQVTASVDETLNFCAFQAGATCGAGTGATVALGTLSSSVATGATSKLVAGTNASTGYVISYLGATLTGPTTIAATGLTGAQSSTGTAQFGINLVSNAGTPGPAQGSNPSGGSGSASANYGTGNTYSFVPSTLTQVASAGGASADTVYTVSYLANIPSNQQAGSYSTTLTYVCTATF